MAETAYMEEIGRSVENLTFKILKAELGVGAFRSIIVDLAKRVAGFEKPMVALLNDRRKAESDITRIRTTGIESYRGELSHANDALKLLNLKIKKEEIVEKLGLSGIAVLTTELGLLKQAAYHYQDIQQNLIEANVSSEHRYQLAADTLKIVSETGASFGDATKAAAALVSYSMDEEQSWKQNLKLVTQLEHGIGLNVNEAARLATITERQVGGNFKAVADTLATIVDRTSLAASEAAKLAESIESAVSAMREGLGGQIDSVIRVVGEYEGAFKRLGGQTGEVTKLIDSLTTIQGMPAAGLIGIGNPEFLSSAKDTEDVLRRIGDTVNQFTRGIGGWQRQAQLEALSQIIGISARQLNLMGRLQAEVNKQRGAEIGIQERFQEQMKQTGQGFTRLRNELSALFEGALLPLVQALNWVTGKIADLVAMINQNDAAAFSLQSIFAGVGVLFGTRLIASIGAAFGLPFAPVIAALAGIGVTIGLIAVGLQKYFRFRLDADAQKFEVKKGQDTLTELRARISRSILDRDSSLIKETMSKNGGFIGQEAEELSYQRAADFIKDNYGENIGGAIIDAFKEAQKGSLSYSDALEKIRGTFGSELANDLESKRVGFAEASQYVQDNIIQPLISAIRTTEATKSLSTDPYGPEQLKPMEKFFKELTAAMTEATKQGKLDSEKERDANEKAQKDKSLHEILTQPKKPSNVLFLY